MWERGCSYPTIPHISTRQEIKPNSFSLALSHFSLLTLKRLPAVVGSFKTLYLRFTKCLAVGEHRDWQDCNHTTAQTIHYQTPKSDPEPSNDLRKPERKMTF